MLKFNVNNSLKIYKYKILLACVFIFLALVLRYIGIGQYVSLENIKANKHLLINFIEQNYIVSVLIYLLIFSLASFLSIPVTIILNIVAGFFFGLFPGVLYVNIGTVTGSMMAFLTFRYLLGDLVKEKYKDKLAKFNAHIKKQGYSYLLSLQLFPATPSFLINIFSGMTSIRLWTFIWTTSVGIFPGSFVYVFAGRQLSKIESTKDILSWPIILAFILLGLLSLLPVLLHWFFNNKHK